MPTVINPSRPVIWKIMAILLSVVCCLVFFIPLNPNLDLTPIFLRLFYIEDMPATFLGLLLTLFAAFAQDRRGRAQAFFRWIGNHPAWITAIAFSITATGAWFVYHAHPLSMDEYAPRLQSEIFAAGHLTGQIPPTLAAIFTPEWFNGWFLHVSRQNGTLASAYWPGLALVMTPFSLLGVPWLCNPCVTAATFAGLARLLDLLVEDPAAKGVALLATLASPVILINGMSFYGMPLQLLCALMFTENILRETRTRYLVAGAWAAFGMTAVNPVPLLLYCIPWTCWIAIKSPLRHRAIAAVIAGALPIALLLGLGWKLFLIETFSNPQHDALGNGIGSLLNILQAPSSSLLIARGIALIKLCIWAMPGLLVLAMLAWHNPKRHDLVTVLGAVAILTLTGYLFVPFDQGHGWGYRYFHTAWLTLPILAAIGIENCTKSQSECTHIYGFTMAAAFGSLLLALPLRAIQVESLIANQLQQIPSRIANNSRQIVFVRVACGAYTADLVQNDPFLRGNELRLVSKGEQYDAQIATTLGSNPHVVANGPCGNRWQLD